MAYDQLPAQQTPFVGRDTELSEIQELLHDPDCRALTLVGPGGIGKTRLALEVARQQQTNYPHGAYFVPLQAVSEPVYIINALAEAVGLQTSQQGDPKRQLLNHLRGREFLVVLDNFEHLLAGAPLVSDLLAEVPGATVLATSRENLNIQEEWLYHVTGMHFPQLALHTPENGNGTEPEPEHQTAPEALARYSAVSLFVHHARRMRSDFSVNDELAGIIDICRLVEGMPLALELAAGWVGLLSCHEIAGELADNLDILKTRSRNVPSRHSSMRAVLDHSWSLLSDEELHVLKRLSVFQGSFTREAAGEITSASLLTLSALVDKSLLRRAAADRYDLHELIRQYAEDILSTYEEAYHAARDAHCQYYADFLAAAWPMLQGSQPKEALDAIEVEIENVRTCWHWALQQQDSAAILRSLDSLWFFYDTRGWYREGEHMFTKALEAFGYDETGQLTDPLLGKLLARKGILVNSLYLSDRAQAYLRKALNTARHNADAVETAFTLTRLAETMAFIDELEDAHALFDESLAMYRQLDHAWGQAFVFTWLGNVHTSLGNARLARRCSQHALQIFRELDNRWGVAITLPSLAYQSISLQAYQAAAGLALEGAEACEDIGIQWGMAMSLTALGHAEFHLGHLAAARSAFTRSAQLALEHELQRFIHDNIMGLALIIAETGDKLRAVEILSLSLNHVTNGTSWENIAIDYLSVLGTLEEQLPQGAYTDALRRGKQLDFEAAIKTLLAQEVAEQEKAAQEVATRQEAAAESPPQAAASPDVLHLVEPLTDRELEILALVAEGLSNRAIAETLVLAVGTVKWYLNQIYSKLHVSSRTQAIAQAREHGLLP